MTKVYIPKGAPKGGDKFAWALPGFDDEVFCNSEAGLNFAKMQEIYEENKDDEMNPQVLEYWEALGVKKELYDAEINNGSGKYAVFTLVDMDCSKKYALVYDSHGGLCPINKYETMSFPRLVGKEKFICVCPWNGGPSNDEVHSEFPRIIAALKEKQYPIDETRIYATGYSAGSDATGVLGCAWPEMIAAISPNPGGNLFAKGRWYLDEAYYQKNKNLRMPIACVGGTMDGGDRYPFEKEEGYTNFNIWMETIVKVPNYQKLTSERSRWLCENSENPAKRFFGVDFSRTFVIPSIEGTEWYCGEFYDENGDVLARFITADGFPHAQTKYYAPIVWDFLKHYSRDLKTGESIYTPVVVDGIS